MAVELASNAMDAAAAVRSNGNALAATPAKKGCCTYGWTFVSSIPVICALSLTIMEVFNYFYDTNNFSQTRTGVSVLTLIATAVDTKAIHRLEGIASLQGIVDRQQQVMKDGAQLAVDLNKDEQKLGDTIDQAAKDADKHVAEETALLQAKAEQTAQMEAISGKITDAVAGLDQLKGLSTQIQSHEQTIRELHAQLETHAHPTPAEFQHNVVEPVQAANHETAINITQLQQLLAQLKSAQRDKDSLNTQFHAEVVRLEALVQQIAEQKAEILRVCADDQAALEKDAALLKEIQAEITTLNALKEANPTSHGGPPDVHG